MSLTKISNPTVAWKPENLSLFLNVTTACQASCPQCGRTDVKTGKPHRWLQPLTKWSPDQFRAALVGSEDIISHLEFCGNWGEPALLHDDLIKMIEYALDNTKATISIRTNGSVWHTDWWYRLGNMHERITTYFAIEGLTQDMHSFYRQGTKLSHVLSNMKAYSKGSRGKAIAFVILFEHNENYWQEIGQLSRDNGAYEVNWLWSNARFRKKGELTFFSEKNEILTLRPPSEFTLLKLNMLREVVSDKTFNAPSETINCSWSKHNFIAINPDGQVVPCCFVSEILYNERLYKKHPDTIIQQYPKDEQNVFKTPLRDMLSPDGWLNKKFAPTWSDNPIRECTNFCTLKYPFTKKIFR